MVVLFTHEIHSSLIQGEFFNKGGVLGNDALQNYLFNCDKGLMICRSRKEDTKERGISYISLEGNGIRVVPINEFRASTLFENYRIVRNSLGKANCYLVRLPGMTGLFVGLILLLTGKKYGVELAGDVKESLVEVYNRPRFFTRVLIDLFGYINRLIIRKASVVSYRSYELRKKYPNRNRQNEFVFSGAQIRENDRGSGREPRHYEMGEIRLLYIGRLTREKGVKFLIEAVSQIYRMGHRVILTIVGDGKELDELKAIVTRENLQHSIIFKGKLDKREYIHRIMDESHIFVIPSVTEGMPRALIEAMARGMVAIGSETGGIPEMLDSEFLFQPKKSDCIAAKIIELKSDPVRLSEISRQNIELSKAHWIENITRVKSKFWDKLCENERK